MNGSIHLIVMSGSGLFWGRCAKDADIDHSYAEMSTLFITAICCWILPDPLFLWNVDSDFLFFLYCAHPFFWFYEPLITRWKKWGLQRNNYLLYAIPSDLRIFFGNKYITSESVRKGRIIDQNKIALEHHMRKNIGNRHNTAFTNNITIGYNHKTCQTERPYGKHPGRGRCRQ